MKGLGGVRVLLVDDKPDEALPVIKAFSQVGVSVAYFDGSTTLAEKRRLCGVRLAILDMNLGVTGSDETIASTLVQTLSQIMSADNGPYGVLIWTGHPHLKPLVSRYLFQHPSLPKPVFLEMMKKAAFRRVAAGGRQRFAMRKLSNALLATLSEHSPLECLQAWEGASFRAATNVTNSVTQFGGEGATDLDEWKKAWSDEALKLIRALGKAQAESKLSESNVIPSVFFALNPLLTDRLDNLVAESAAGLDSHVSKVLGAAATANVGKKAKLNTMLHLASDNLDQLNAGNLYLFAKGRRAAFMPTLRELLKDAVQGNQQQASDNISRLQEAGRLVGIEITPICDHAQGKLGYSRVICGIAVPPDLEGRLKKAEFLKRLGPFFMEGSGLAPGPYYLVLNARYIPAASPTAVRGLTARARVRAQLLADVQAWAAYQGARQGFTMLA